MRSKSQNKPQFRGVNRRFQAKHACRCNFATKQKAVHSLLTCNRDPMVYETGTRPRCLETTSRDRIETETASLLSFLTSHFVKSIPFYCGRTKRHGTRFKGLKHCSQPPPPALSLAKTEIAK